MRIIVKCAWCGVILQVKQSEEEQGEAISHSICSSCKKKVSQEIKDYRDSVEQEKTHPFNPNTKNPTQK